MMAFGEVAWGSLLGSFFQVLFDRLASSGLNFVSREGLDARLDNWKKTLQIIYSLLNDAEDRQLIGELAVKSWIEDVRDLAYDMEDLLDEFNIESAKQQGVESSTSGGLRKRKWLSFPSFVSNGNMRSKMQDIESRLQDVLTRKDLLNLKEIVGDRSTSKKDAKRLPSTSLKEPCFVGRKEEENAIIQLLTFDVSHTNPTIIPIVGMGGIGKTALAQRIYNDPKITSYFEVKAWACVSDDFNVLGITRAILQSIIHMPCEGKDINWLQVNLKENLLGKKFLIVLDDVWNEKYGEWTTLLKPFESGAEGSKVIVTTRNCKVASIAGAPAYPLKELQQHDCMALFAFHALGVNTFNNHPHLQVIGMKIVDKCKGLPLAAKSLGGLLRTTVEPNEWEAILNNKLWDLPEERNEILPALKLSYIHLPSHLKRCFAYCAIFPKDYEIERDKLIHWWMAEGLLGETNQKNRWDIGLDYFNELVSRSFLQQGKENRFLIHDLIHDLAMSITGLTCFNARQLELDAYESNASLARARHASFVSTFHVTSQKLRKYHKMKKLRSFISLQVGSLDDCNYLSQKALYDLISQLKYARVFSVSHYHIIEVPDSICELKLLRHLDFSYTDIQMLPKSICSIYNLEALVLRGCRRLLELPQEIEKLTNLQYLDIRDTPRLRAMPSNLANLKMVPRFVVAAQMGSRLKELRHLMHPEGELFISELQQVEENRDARDVDLCTKQGIDKLVLQWAQNFSGYRDEERENAVLDLLQPHINLKILIISYYGGTRFPLWLGSALYASIVRVDLCGCCNVTSLPSLGQLPLLKDLHIESLSSMTKVGYEFYGSKKPFPSLKTLVFLRMLAWEDWSHCGGAYEVEAPFGCLQHLVICQCPKLIGRLPRGLDSLTKLEINSCPYLEKSPRIISLPSLHELYLKDCNVGIFKSLVYQTSLITLKISSIPQVTYFEGGFCNILAKLERLEIKNCEKLNYLWQDSDEIHNLASLRSLSIRSCPNLASFMAMPPHLQELSIVECDSLPTLEFESGRFPTSLKSLTIEECKGVVLVTEMFGMEHQCIENISIIGCNNMRSLELHGFSHLNWLEIRNCGALVLECFPPLPIMMSFFKLVSCPNVKSLSNNLHQLTSLRILSIEKCENIKCFPEGGLPPNLNRLEIVNCGALEVECFPPLPITMSDFYLRSCPNIKCLPNNLHQLPSLSYLSIGDCKNIRCFPEKGLPPNLYEFYIRECENMMTPVRQWGLHRLISLDGLRIDGSVGGVSEKPCFIAPSDDEDDAWGFLPSSLSHLWIRNMTEGERLSSGLCNHLPSLRSLYIYNCPKLRFLPDDCLPPSLEELYISKCGVLEEQFSKPNGDYCHLFQEIPCVIIGDRPIN